MVEVNEANKAVLIKLGYIKPEIKEIKEDVIITESDSEHNDSNSKRTKKRKSTK